MATKGRPAKADIYSWLKPLVTTAINEIGLLELCAKADCVNGRGSIRNWLDGRTDRKGKLTERALPDVIALALMKKLGELYPKTTTEVGNKFLLQQLGFIPKGKIAFFVHDVRFPTWWEAQQWVIAQRVWGFENCIVVGSV